MKDKISEQQIQKLKTKEAKKTKTLSCIPNS